MHRLKPFLATTILLLVLLQGVSVFAQETIALSLSDPFIEAFPRIKIFLQILDETGLPISDLPAESFSVLEDNQIAPDLEVTQAEVGTRLVFAINTSPALRIRDSLGRSRFDLVRTALLDWFALPDHAMLELDEYSLITAEGIQIERTRASADIASVLDRFESTFEIEGDYELLFRALDITNQPPPVDGMPASIFFITPLLRPPLDIPLETIIARAQASKTAIYPILIGSEDIVEQPELETFERLAAETGGAIAIFDSDQGLLPLAQEMISRRNQYGLFFRSLATTSGPHEIRVRLSTDQFELDSPPRSYVLELREPEVTLLNLPSVILRSTDDPSTPLESIPPTSQDVEFAVQFPDGYDRPIVQAQLLVDGQIAVQTLEHPFSPLTWDLSDELENESISLQVTVLDSLGYQAQSLPSVIDIQVDLPPRGLAAIRPALSSLLVALGVLFGGIALAAIVLSLGRRPISQRPRISLQPVKEPTAVSRLRHEVPEEPIEAYLYPLDGDPESPGTIYFTGVEVTIGRDPNFATVPIDDPSVEGLHARIIRQVDGSYQLRDQGSKAGTWIHYEEIPSAGQKLAHGDIVHFGRSGYRFAFSDPPAEKEILITRESEGEEATEDSTT